MFIYLSQFFLYVAAFTPLIIHKRLFFPFITGKVFFFRTAVELALLFFIIHILASQDPKKIWHQIRDRFKDPVLLSVSIFALLAVFVSLISINPTQAFWSNFERGEGAFQVLHYVLFFLLITLTFTKKKHLHALLFTHIGITVLVAGYGLLQVYGNPAHPLILAGGPRASGTLGNPSYLAAYLLLTLPILGYFFLHYKDRLLRAAILLTSVFEIFVLTKTGTRGAFLGVFVGLFVLLFISMFTNKTKRLRLISQISFVAVTGLGILFFATSSAPIWQHIPGLNARLVDFQGATSAIQPRLWTWGSAVSTFLEKPVFGWGLENFAEGFDKYYNPRHYLVESFFDRTHNVFLEYLVSGGIVLFLSWLTIFYFFLRRIFSRKPKDMWFAVSLAGIIAYFVQGFFLFDVGPIYLTLFLFFTLFLNTEKEYPSLVHENEAYRISGASFASSILITILIVGNLIVSVLLPLQKNLLLSKAVITQNIFQAPQVPDAQKPPFSAIIAAYERAYEFKSPVGQEETVSMLLRFIAGIAEYFARIEDSQKTPADMEIIHNLVVLADRWYDESNSLFSGSKNAYVAGAIDLNYAFTTVNGSMRVIDSESLARGKAIYNEVLEKAPTRIEFLVILREIARREKDTEADKILTAKLTALRPDLHWESITGR